MSVFVMDWKIEKEEKSSLPPHLWHDPAYLWGTLAEDGVYYTAQYDDAAHPSSEAYEWLTKSDLIVFRMQWNVFDSANEASPAMLQGLRNALIQDCPKIMVFEGDMQMFRYIADHKEIADMVNPANVYVNCRHKQAVPYFEYFYDKVFSWFSCFNTKLILEFGASPAKSNFLFIRYDLLDAAHNARSSAFVSKKITDEVGHGEIFSIANKDVKLTSDFLVENEMDDIMVFPFQPESVFIQMLARSKIYVNMSMAPGFGKVAVLAALLKTYYLGTGITACAKHVWGDEPFDNYFDYESIVERGVGVLGNYEGYEAKIEEAHQRALKLDIYDYGRDEIKAVLGVEKL